MAADYSLHHACGPKMAIGNGDALKGSNRLQELLKTNARLELLEQTAARLGKDPRTIRLTSIQADPGQISSRREPDYDDLVAQVKPLQEHVEECVGCPANLFDSPFGCYGTVPYPISRAAEEWLAERIQPSSTVGGFLCIRAMQDFGYTGEPIRAMRSAGLLERNRTASKVVEGSWLSKKQISVDQVLQGMIALDEPIQPAHALGVLMWLGCVRVKGRAPGNVSEAPEVLKVFSCSTPEERMKRTTLDIPQGPNDRSTASLQGLLNAFYLAWLYDVPLLVSY